MALPGIQLTQCRLDPAPQYPLGGVFRRAVRNQHPIVVHRRVLQLRLGQRLKDVHLRQLLIRHFPVRSKHSPLFQLPVDHIHVPIQDIHPDIVAVPWFFQFVVRRFRHTISLRIAEFILTLCAHCDTIITQGGDYHGKHQHPH